MSFTQVVKTKEGVEKTVVANTEAELAEAVKVAKGEEVAVAPDINNPKDGNKIVSPENLHTDPLVSDRFTTNDVTQTGQPKAEKSEEVKDNKAPKKK